MRWISAGRDQRRRRALAQAGFSYALALTHERERAEDSLQRAWLKLMEAYGEVADRPILFRTIKNLVRDDARGHRSQDQAVEDTDTVPTALTMAGEEPVGGDLDRLLARLGSTEREVLYLNAVEGYTADEIATMMDRPRGSVLSIAARAKAKLRRQVADEPAMTRW